MRHHLMEEPYAVIPPVRICAGYPTFSTYKYGGNEEIYGDRILDMPICGCPLLILFGANLTPTPSRSTIRQILTAAANGHRGRGRLNTIRRLMRIA